MTPPTSVPQPVAPPSAVPQAAAPSKSNTKLFVILGCGCLILLIIIAVIAAVAIPGLALFKSGNVNVTDTTTNSLDQAQSKKLATAADRKTFLSNFVNHYKSTKQFSMTGSLPVTESGQTYTFNVAVTLDNTNLQMTMSLAGSSKKVEFMTFDGVNYISDGTGTWYQLPSDSQYKSPIDASQYDSFASKLGANAVDGTDYTYQGVAACGNTYCHVFQTVESGTTNTYNIGIDDNLLHSLVSTNAGTTYTFNVDNTAVTLTKPANAQVLGNDQASNDIILGIYAGLAPNVTTTP